MNQGVEKYIESLTKGFIKYTLKKIKEGNTIMNTFFSPLCKRKGSEFYCIRSSLDLETPNLFPPETL